MEYPASACEVHSDVLMRKLLWYIRCRRFILKSPMTSFQALKIAYLTKLGRQGKAKETMAKLRLIQNEASKINERLFQIGESRDLENVENFIDEL